MASKKRKEKDITNEFLKSAQFSIKDFKFTEKQRELVKIIRDRETKVVFVEGPAGSSKTFLAVFCGLMALREDSRSKLKYIRALVESSQSKIGFLKGSLEDKISPYAGPLLDKLDEFLSRYDADKLIQEGVIQSLCPNFLRGSTFKREFVIVDESQEISFKDLVTIITRLGEDSTLIITGDSMQSDIKNSGFSQMINIFNDDESKGNGMHCFRFTSEDVMRSGILKFILKKLEKI